MRSVFQSAGQTEWEAKLSQANPERNALVKNERQTVTS